MGVPRSACGCAVCVRNCRHMPGFLVPDDLGRLLPPRCRDPLGWAEENLLASPGALVKQISTGEEFRVQTLVPAVKPDGACIHLTAQGECAIHANAPFGCAFFSCGPEPPGIAHEAVLTVLRAWRGEDFPYAHVYRIFWLHLWQAGRCQQAPEILRARMRAEIESEAICG